MTTGATALALRALGMGSSDRQEKALLLNGAGSFVQALWGKSGFGDEGCFGRVAYQGIVDGYSVSGENPGVWVSAFVTSSDSKNLLAAAFSL